MTKDTFFKSEEGKQMTAKLHVLRRDTILRKEQMYTREILEAILPIIKPTLVWEDLTDQPTGTRPDYVSEAKGFKFTIITRYRYPAAIVWIGAHSFGLTSIEYKEKLADLSLEDLKQLCQDWLDNH